MTLLAINWGNAISTTLMGFGIVFVILCLLVIVINLFGKAMAPTVLVKKKKTEDQNEVTDATGVQEYDEVHLSADETAAIAMALHLFYGDVHDEESNIMTIKKVERRYSPWNSKIYGMNNLVR